jgi:glycosyltransferase involved in cell wall biosynthesis
MLVSVVIPTFNRRERIGGAIRSVLEQQGVNVEILVVDDGSTDGTKDWLEREFSDAPLRVIANARSKGPAGARNTGILHVQGDIVALLDSDDRFLPGHLQAGLDVFLQAPRVSVIFGPARYVHNGRQVDYMGPNFIKKLSLAERQSDVPGGFVLAPSFFEHLLQFGCFFNLSSVMLRAGAARNLMNETLRISEDYEFWVRLARTERFACLEAPQIEYAIHDDNVSFEKTGLDSNNAPDVIKALDVIGNYENLSGAQRRLLSGQKASVLFDWAYNSRQHRRYLEALRLHGYGLLCGSRRKHLLAMSKTLAAGLLRM